MCYLTPLCWRARSRLRESKAGSPDAAGAAAHPFERSAFFRASRKASSESHGTSSIPWL